MTTQERAPRIWRVLGDKRGDNSQVEMIADTLRDARGWGSELRHLEMRPEFVRGKPKVGPTLYHLDRTRSDALEPPWPDLILTSGRRPANAALWIKRQSGGRSRIVIVGKPSGSMAPFDLIVTSAETLPAPFDNVLPVGLPLMGIDPDRLAAGAEAWRERLAPLPRPLVAVLIGGPTIPFRYDAAVLCALRARIDAVRAAGGTPYLVGSRRTPPDFLHALADGMPGDTPVFDWAMPGGDNPYAGLLALADRFVVTGDSISMLVEVARLGKPLEIVPLSTGWLGGLDHARRSASAWLFQPRRAHGLAETARIALARGLSRARLVPQTRHFPRFHEMLVARGLATWVGDTSTRPADTSTPAADSAALGSEADMTRILARIDRLSEGRS